MLRHLISGSIISNLACRIRPKDFSLTGVRLLKSWVSLKCESNFAYKKCEPPTPFDRRFSSAINKPLTVDLHTEDNLIYDRTDGPREIVLELDQILNSTKNNSKIMKLYEHLRGDGNGAKKIVGYWFLGSSALIFGIVILGGLTRLTESGLSMVDWNLIHFSPPQTDAAWAAYFDQYKMYPEFLANHDGQMTIEEFKRIYYMEHAHRVYGRLLGLFIIVPSIFFAVYKRADFINSKTIRKMTLGCSALVIFQVSLLHILQKLSLLNTTDYSISLIKFFCS